MSTPRYRGADRTVPKGHCRWCREPIDPAIHPRARTWHPDCVREWEDQRPDVLRQRTRERDGGCCAECGCRTMDLRSRVRGMAYFAALRSLRIIPARHAAATYVTRVFAYRLPRDLVQIATGDVSPWAMDHIVPLWAGGANHLDNLQTLCLPCHKAKTRREAGERARLRAEEAREADGQLAIGGAA